MQKISDHLKLRGQAVMLVWIQFNQANEPVNCIHKVSTERFNLKELPSFHQDT